MIYPVLEYTEAGSSYSFVDHPPAKSASKKHSSHLSFFGYIVSPFSFVSFRYLMILFTSLSCEAFGLAENLAAECVAYAMSGLENLKYNLVGQLLIDTPKLKFGLLLSNIYLMVALPLVCLLDLSCLAPLIH